MNTNNTLKQDEKERLEEKFKAFKEFINFTFDKETNLFVIGFKELKEANFAAVLLRGNTIEIAKTLSDIIADDYKTREIIKASFLASFTKLKDEELLKIYESMNIVLTLRGIKTN